MTIATSSTQQRSAWEGKPVLRAVYTAYHHRIRQACRPGRTLEIGAGSGHLRAGLSDCIGMDIVTTPWIDVVGDAHSLPFRDGAIANLVMIDVFHHLAYPTAFLREVFRVLQPGGRLIMIEPAVTPVSVPILKLFHHEDMIMRVDPFADGPQTGPDPADANMALPHLVFVTHQRRLAEMFPGMVMAKRSWFDLWAYPLSGGFQRWSLLPAAFARPLLALEAKLEPLLGRLLGFRMMVVMEKQP
ncbi:MAG: class I SAM-dependent methyltransferase [Ferrovibrio sp.]|uniref:class I SAM-dependent methyltransferase n=1 Tax=Ferrovibrio sp. TaxID=1917215 RepID=UPI00262B0BD7|nr:class I SAM-dependent methyltransferase [Ferrovibrio sp.]MCW0234826.1 class I SAM-dependent methyltransferase [Ferrovibrio sp.]